MPPTPDASARPVVEKVQTGISGFDEITDGGIPQKRTTVLYGGSGTGKTVFALRTLAHAVEAGSAGAFLSFGETVTELRENGRSLGVDLATLEAADRLILDSVHIDPEEVTAAEELTLEGVLVRIEQAIERIGAKIVVIDAVNVLSQTIADPAATRAALQRMLSGHKKRGVTTIVTVEVADAGDVSPEEYLADCVVHLRNRVERGIATRRLRIVKYRGSHHRLNAYPFVISNKGIVLTPMTDEVLDKPSSSDRISVGIDGVDAILQGGVFRGDTVFVSGSAGSGKTSVTVSIGVAACRRGERCLFIAMEEPASQIIRNMQAIGLDLTHWQEEGLLRIISPKRSLEGLESHLVYILEQIETFRPDVVVVDPLTPLMAMGHPDDVRETIIRLLSIVKSRGITAVCTLLAREEYLEEQNTPFASFVDDIILVRNIEKAGERHRTLSVLKARGTAHATNVRKFQFTQHGLQVHEIHDETESPTHSDADL